jgi:hypothetical protein
VEISCLEVIRELSTMSIRMCSRSYAPKLKLTYPVARTAPPSTTVFATR